MAQRSGGVGRRSFLAGIAAGAAGVASAAPAAAAPTTPAAAAAAGPVPPSAINHAAGIELAQVTTAQAGVDATEPLQLRSVVDPYHIKNPGSDYMVDCLKKLGYDYVAAIPGSTFRGFQESVINYTPGSPEWLTTTHEEVSTAMAHGYAKASGKPMISAVHGVVGVQHASMAVYNAYADRAPLLLVSANYADAAIRASSAEWDHNAVDMSQILRGYVKYADQPASLQHYGESLARAHGLAMTPPYGPVFLVLEQNLQEAGMTVPPPPMKPWVPVEPPAADGNALNEIAKMLVAAQNPVIVADRAARTPAGLDLIVQLAETLQAPVVDQLGRLNFPTNHYLWQPGAVPSADVILALDVGDLFDVLSAVPDVPYRATHSKIKPTTKVISIDAELNVPEENWQVKQRYYQPDYAVAADSQASLPGLIEAVKRTMTDTRRNQNADREQRFRRAFAQRRAADAQMAAIGWNAQPISVPRMVMEVWNAVKDHDWALVSQSGFQSNWQQRLWDFTKHYQFNGGSGAAGIGYTSSAALGAALAHKGKGTICVDINGDGDYLMSPGSVWTAAHHQLPLLTIIHNNRAWHQELMFVQNIADRRNRHPERGSIGTVLTNPYIDYAKVASGFGVYAQGPITNPADLGPALKRAVAMVAKGEPAFIDVVSQGR